jgi:PPP family 3-phenylpropionic acid transporter
VWISIFPLWLRSKGLSESDIGLCIALGSVLAVAVNPPVGALADRTGRRKALLLVLTSAAAASSLFNFAAEGFALLLAAYIATRLFSASLIPLSESIILANLQPLRLDFGRVRACGSAAVVVLALVLGRLVDTVGIAVVPVVLTTAYVVQALLAARLPDASQVQERPPAAPLSEVARLPRFGLLIGSGAVSQACHGMFYAFSTFYWLASGLSATTIGALWALGVTAEIVAFALGGRLILRVRPALIIVIGCAAAVLRWGLLGASGSLSAAIVVQLLQGATLGLGQVGSAYYINAAVPTRILSTGTGVYSASTGLLAALLIYVGGLAYPSIGGGIFLIASGLCVLALLSALVLAFGDPTKSS